jgi:hypothetical protein
VIMDERGQNILPLLQMGGALNNQKGAQQ